MRRKRGWNGEREGKGGRENWRLAGVFPALPLASAAVLARTSGDSHQRTEEPRRRCTAGTAKRRHAARPVPRRLGSSEPMSGPAADLCCGVGAGRIPGAFFVFGRVDSASEKEGRLESLHHNDSSGAQQYRRVAWRRAGSTCHPGWLLRNRLRLGRGPCGDRGGGSRRRARGDVQAAAGGHRRRAPARC